METKKDEKKMEFHSIVTALNNIGSHPKKIYPTKMKQLDKAIGGGLSTGLYVLGAIPNLGKSTFALQLAKNLSSSGYPVLFFSLEMSEHRLVSKLIAQELYIKNRAGYTSDQIISNIQKDVTLKNEVNQIVTEKLNEKCKNLYVFEQTDHISSAKDIQEIVTQFCNTHKETEPSDGQIGKNLVVIVDYLQLLKSTEPTQWSKTDKTIVDENVMYFKEMAKEFPVMLISSFSRDNYKIPVSLSAFKESGSIEYAADVVLGMELSAVKIKGKELDLNLEKDKVPREIDIVILKQRYGRSGGTPIAFHYYAAHDYFEEINSEIEDFMNMYKELPELKFF